MPSVETETVLSTPENPLFSQPQNPCILGTLGCKAIYGVETSLLLAELPPLSNT